MVAGRRALMGSARLRTALPLIWAWLDTLRHELEAMAGDAQDFDFTVQDGELFLLQARNAKRTPWAAVRIAVDLMHERIVAPAAMLVRLSDIDLASVARTIVASLGVASGPIVFDTAAASQFLAAGTAPILVRTETTTSDVVAVATAAGVLTAPGGRPPTPRWWHSNSTASVWFGAAILRST